MTTAYIVAGKFVTLKELTCPNGHSNRAIDFDNLGTSELLPCEFKHLGRLGSFIRGQRMAKVSAIRAAGLKKSF